MTKQLSEHFAARFKSCTAEQQLPLRNNLVKTLLRTMFFLAVMVIGTGSAWGDVSLGKVTIGGTITQHTSTEQNFGNNGVIAAGLISGTAEIKNPAGYYAKITEDGKIKIRVNKGSVVPGDILKVNVGPSGDGSQNLGYIVEGSNTFVEAGQKTAPDKYTKDQDIAYTLKASDIQNEDASYDFIQINRSGGGHAYAYHSVEIVRPAGNVIKWTSGDIPTGCDAWYTLGDDETPRKESISGVAAGTVIRLRATDSGNTHKIIEHWTFGVGDGVWNNPASRDMTGWDTYVQDGVLALQPHFCDAYTMTAVAGTGCSSVSLKGTKDANTTEINGIKQKSSAKYSLTFTAISESGADFDGWYNGDTKISGENPYDYGEYSSGGTTDLSLTAKFKVADSGHPDVTCEKNKIDLSKISGYGNLTYNYDGNKASVTISQESQYGNGILIKFAKAQDMSHVKTITINGGIQFGDIPFTDGTTNWWPPRNFADGKTIINTNCDSKYTAITEIRLRPGNTTESFEISSIVFEYDHTPATPQFIDGTTAEMTISQGDDITLSVDNSFAFWREYQDANYVFNQQIYDRIPSNEYDTPVRKITGLEIGDYYFAAEVGRTCKFGKWHGSELAKVHVKVTDPINTVDVNGKKREYATYVPDGISGEVGVIFSLHGASNDYWNGRVDFNAIAEAKKNVDGKKFIVVYPRGLMRQLRGQERGWETYTESNTEDVEFFKAIVGDIPTKYAGLTVDMSRIYLAGFSNGGMMAYKAAHQAGDFFAAFASVGGFPVNESHLYHAGKQPTPFIHIQGADDKVFPSATYDLSTIAHNMIYRNGAHFNPYDSKYNSDGGVVPDNTNVTREIHIADKGGVAYFLYKIADMGHTWSYDWDGNGGDDVATAIWNFFDYSGKVNNIDKTLKFRINDSGFWSQASGLGFDNVNSGTSVLSYGGHTKTDNGSTFNNKNLWHSLQFNGGINGAAHFLKLNVETEEKTTDDFFLVKLTKTGDSKPVFSKRYQAGRGKKDLYINFVALPGFNEYKLEVTKNKKELVVKVHGMEFYSGRCEDKSTNEHPIEENPVFFADIKTIVSGLNPIYQPVFGKSYSGIAKEYLPIAEIPVGILPEGNEYRPSDIPVHCEYKVIEDNLKISDAADATVMTSLPSTVITNWRGATTETISGTSHGSSGTTSYGKLFNIAISGKTDEDTEIKSNNAFIFVPNEKTYTVDKFKGLNISQLGRAEMPEYLNGTRGAFPDRGVIAIKLQGTLDFYLLAQNDVTYTGTDPNAARRTLKVYYTNDQLDGELKELDEWDFFGTRSENGYSDKNGQSLAPLAAGVRLPQLGKDGTCTVFITYEGKRENGGASFTHESTDEEKIWIKGFVIKRPDLKVTIGRTDSKYSSQEYNGETENTKCTRFGENKPYVWSFENVGFNNTRNKDGHSDINEKKINEKDDRTYVCGGSDDNFDHVLLYSDGESTNNDDKVQFDGRVLGKEHIEFLKASVYNIPTATDNRKIYDPIQSNGLKVNVTGSGWFKIMCSAPNGPVNMKVYTQPNYGSSYISLLREFRVEPVAPGDLKTGETTETAFREYTVYLKSRGIHNGNNGFWDGETADAGKEEIMRQSLFVVFDNIGEASSYAEGHPQLNIHQLSWLNEEPADYVFQREEDPKLLTTWQAIRRDGDGNKTLDDSSDANVVLYWKAGNDDDANYPVLKGHANGSYNVINQVNTDDAAKGVKSPGGYASTSVPSDAGTYDAYWDIAAPARVNALVEKAYGDNAKKTDTQYAYSSGNNTEFDTPVSGSFIRISAMKNTYVVAHVIPGNTSVSSNATPHSGATVYVLDETGNPIPSSSSDPNASRLGYIAAMVNGGSAQYGGVASQDKTIRIDFVANAGKEYFICANGASISLARLEVHDWRNWTHKPTKAETLALTDNADNSSKIETAYETGNYYRDATLTRTFAAGKWASLVLPFSLNEQKFKEVFGENAKCIHFTDVDTKNNIVKLTHHYYNMIVAGRPVFIYTPDEVVNPQFKDITLQTKVVKNTTTTSGFTFHASYDGTEMKWNDLYMNNANAIKYVSNDKSKRLTYPGMRSFIQSPNEYDPSDGRAGSAGAKAVFLSFLDDDYQDIPTGIEELISAELGEDVVVVTKTTKIYDLLGNVMGEGSDINSLPAGIYIVNGKKYIVK